jgi:hypothetical protein
MTSTHVISALVVAVVCASAAAHAQDGPPQTSAGPMTVERVHNGFAIAPDVKVTRVDGATGVLAGAYGGWMFDNTLLLGGGAYWLTNPSNGNRMTYGGAVVQWLARTDRRVGFGGRALVGLGSARLTDTVTGFGFDMDQRGMMFDPRFPFGRPGGPLPSPGPIRVRFGRDFFVAEPQADLLVNLTRHVRLDWSAGYRFIGDSRVDARLRGATGRVALEIGGSTTTRQ